MPVIKYDQTYPKDLKAMTPSAFNEPDNINPVPENPGTDGAYDPAARTRTDLWPQHLINLKDVDGANWWEHAGMSLLVRRNGSPSQEGYNIEYGFPDRLEAARNFSVSGDGISEPQPFDGTADVVMPLTDVAATTLKNPREFSLTGDIVANEVTFDATGNVILVTRYENVIPDDKLPNWIAAGFNDLSTRVDNLEITVSSNYITLTNKINAVDARVTTVDNRVTTINNSTQTQINNLGSQVAGNTSAIGSLNSAVSSQGTAIAELQSASSGPVGEVGSYAMLGYPGTAEPGRTVASGEGGGLSYSNGFGTSGAPVPSGQVWECCGTTVLSANPGTSSTLWRRVS